MVEELDTSANTKSTLFQILARAQSAMDESEYKKMRRNLGDFIVVLIDRSSSLQDNPNKIPLDEANSLILEAVEVLIGIALE